MEIFFLLIFGYFILPFLLGRSKSKTSKSKLKALVRSQQTPPQRSQGPISQPVSDNATRAVDLRARLQAANAIRLAASKKASSKNKNSPPPKDSNDKNSRRRSDWGKRAGPELISTQNILFGIMLAAIIYLLQQIANTF